METRGPAPVSGWRIGVVPDALRQPMTDTGRVEVAALPSASRGTDMTLWTILAVALVPVVLVGVAVHLRDRRRTGWSGPSHPHQHDAGAGEGWSAGGFALMSRRGGGGRGQ